MAKIILLVEGEVKDGEEVNHPRLKPVGLPLAPPRKGESEAIGLLT